ncbi:MAG: hypothetical protein AAB515_01540 [Patescibacteria group bacterium]
MPGKSEENEDILENAAQLLAEFFIDQVTEQLQDKDIYERKTLQNK